MKLLDLSRAMTILASYCGPETRSAICAEHDELFAHGPHVADVTPDDRDRLAELGWTWDNEWVCWRANA